MVTTSDATPQAAIWRTPIDRLVYTTDADDIAGQIGDIRWREREARKIGEALIRCPEDIDGDYRILP